MSENTNLSKGTGRKGEIVWLDPASLKPYPNNPRNNKKAIDAVAESIKRFGFNVPITVDEDMVVATGHTRLEAAKRLGLTKVPVIVLRDLSEEEIKAWRLADNKTAELATWDEKKLKLEIEGLTGIDLSLFGFKADGSISDVKEDGYAKAPPKKPKSKYGQIYRLGNHRLMCGDSTKHEDMKALMAGEEADCVMTDPPYNVCYEGEAGTIMNDAMSVSQFSEFLEAACRTMALHLKKGGAIYLWYASRYDGLTQEAMRRCGMPPRETLIWNKSQFTIGRQDYQWKHEPCLYGWKEGAPHYFINDRGYCTVIEEKAREYEAMTKAQLIKAVRDLLKVDAIPTTIINEDKPTASKEHPTMKPVRLLARLIANSTRPGELVLDSFGGSGSTLIACEQLGRRANLMELDPKYVDVIIDRYEKLTGQKAELIASI